MVEAPTKQALGMTVGGDWGRVCGRATAFHLRKAVMGGVVFECVGMTVESVLAMEVGEAS